MIQVALLGTWHVHFDGYAHAVQSNPNCRITALWDPDPAQGAEAAVTYGCDFVASLDALLAREDVDAVVVCTATNLHKEVIMKAANAGKHIFTEKVLCFNEADALAVADAVTANGVKFCISYPWKTGSEFLWIKQALEDGLIGQVNYCRMRNAHNGASSDWLPPTFYDPVACGGGAMMDLGAHSMYILHWFLGMPEKAASAFTHVKVQSVEDNAVTVFTYPNGAIGVSETGFVAENNPFELELVGSKGTILSGGFLGKTCYNIGNGWVFPPLPKSAPSPLEAWIDGILNDAEIPYGIADAVALSKLMEMAYQNIL